MNKNIEYGYKEENNETYSYSDDDVNDHFLCEYFFKTPEQSSVLVSDSMLGSSGAERSWFLENEYDHKVYFLMFAKELQFTNPYFSIQERW